VGAQPRYVKKQISVYFFHPNRVGAQPRLVIKQIPVYLISFRVSWQASAFPIARMINQVEHG
jgi:hypothetical protein